MKTFIILLALSSSAFAFNCKKDCKAEFRQCKIIVNDGAKELEAIYRARPYTRSELRKMLKEVKAKKKEEMGYCKEMQKDCFKDCRS